MRGRANPKIQYLVRALSFAGYAIIVIVIILIGSAFGGLADGIVRRVLKFVH
jgi:ABC-type lipoprotein release transport system permease subunit